MKSIVKCNDNLEELKKIQSKSVDLVYIDPPFNTRRSWMDYDDKWNEMSEYIEFLKPRLVEINRVLKDNGSVFIHVDHNASHYVKIASDSIFGYNNLINEIIWNYGAIGTQRKRGYNQKHNTIFWYAKGKDFTFNPAFKPYKSSESRYNKIDENGKRYALVKRVRKSTGEVYYGKSYRREYGTLLTSVWDDIPIISPTGKERTGYSTQKPERLLYRIIEAASNTGDVVLDAFAGSGTTCAVAKKLGRRSICIDKNPKSCKIMEKRLK